MLDNVWAAAEIDAAYAAILRTIVQPQEPEAGSASLVDLVALCCAGSGGSTQSSQPLALAWNVLYTALYLLDGAEDGDLGDGPWSGWGLGAAINLSTGLLATTGLLLSRLEGAGVSAPIAEIIRVDFFGTLLSMTAGQHQDLTVAEPTLEQCWRIAEAKSGCLFALACRSGALVAGGDRELAARCGEFGRLLGLLIQIGDDLDDLWPKANKPSDLSGGRWTLPLAYAMMVLPSAEQARLRELLRAAPADPEAEAKARSQILAVGAALYLATESRRLHERARETLCAALPDSPARDRLLELLESYTPLNDR
jgi:geranylgeranyl diphosphate synthase, type I